MLGKACLLLLAVVVCAMPVPAAAATNESILRSLLGKIKHVIVLMEENRCVCNLSILHLLWTNVSIAINIYAWIRNWEAKTLYAHIPIHVQLRERLPHPKRIMIFFFFVLLPPPPQNHDRSFDHFFGFASKKLGVNGLKGDEFNYINMSNPSEGKVTVSTNAQYVLYNVS